MLFFLHFLSYGKLRYKYFVGHEYLKSKQKFFTSFSTVFEPKTFFGTELSFLVLAIDNRMSYIEFIWWAIWTNKWYISNSYQIINLNNLSERQVDIFDLIDIVSIWLTRNIPRIGYLTRTKRAQRLAWSTTRKLKHQTSLLIIRFQDILLKFFFDCIIQLENFIVLHHTSIVLLLLPLEHCTSWHRSCDLPRLVPYSCNTLNQLVLVKPPCTRLWIVCRRGRFLSWLQRPLLVWVVRLVRSSSLADCMWTSPLGQMRSWCLWAHFKSYIFFTLFAVLFHVY